jgi:hypothetical protein
MKPIPSGVFVMRKVGLEPDPWQIEVLESQHTRLMLNCCRQAGKSTTVALRALTDALNNQLYKVLVVSRSLRQARELFRIAANYYRRLGCPLQVRKTAEELELSNGSRIVSLPCNPDTIRGFSNVNLLIIDEAARVPDELYRSVRPMLAAASGGRLILLSTPDGRRGFFYEAWVNSAADWHRIEVPAQRIPRISPEFLAEEQRELGLSYYRQEYECSFGSRQGLVYPNFDACVVPGPAPAGRRVGGIDFGYRNPFAALWGVLDPKDILWLTGEHYVRQRPLSYHILHLPRDVAYYADPSGANERAELRCAGFVVREGRNELRSGISAVARRLETGTLRVVEGCCPNLLMEADRYRYASEEDGGGGETPVDQHNHALAALRYLISRVDARTLGRRRPLPAADVAPPVTDPAPAPPKPKRDAWLSYHNEALWTRLF